LRVYTPLRGIKQLVEHVFTATSSREEPHLHAAAPVVQSWLDNSVPEDTRSDREVN
jgi:hypothetical protein